MDLFSGYHYVPIAKKDRPKTVFIVPTAPGFSARLFQFNRMCFVLCNAPATFCRPVDRIFGDIKQEYCLLYTDDSFVFSTSFAEHLIRLEEVLRRLKESGLKFKPSKCALGMSCITFLGHQVSKEGLPPDQEKVKSI